MADHKSGDSAGFSGVPFDASALFEVHKSGLEVWQKIHQSYLEGATTYHGEVLGLVNRRVKRGLDTFSVYASCSSPQDVYAAHIETSQNAMSQYLEDIGRFSELGGKVIAEAVNGNGVEAPVSKKMRKKSQEDE